MNDLQLFKERSNEAYEIYLPHISIDCVVFGFHDTSLKVLLLKLKGLESWGLPGGYVQKNEDVDAAAHRILEARTGVSRIFLEQFKVFGTVNRSEPSLTHMPPDLWYRQRFISIGYYALVNYKDIVPQVDDISDACEWKDITGLPEMMMDHELIYKTALETLRKQLNYKPIGYNLLPEEFTMPELQKLYEIILGYTLNRGNFQRKMLAYDILIKHDKSRKGGAHRSPILYSFDTEKYNKALEGGLNTGW
ncbi:NUDIX hydrolase [Filimonas effusa]|uniref:NUDIX hydrolase n=1 Tax=Filimonas effusa TaxID=2508721 RepID=A0A4Q1DCP9_9BACT|nr:NUDIX domain-containing protein [Filimonas effusa]RXK86319.1 NUDIX hydrolase [Filimonas effusa]